AARRGILYLQKRKRLAFEAAPFESSHDLANDRGQHVNVERLANDRLHDLRVEDIHEGIGHRGHDDDGGTRLEFAQHGDEVVAVHARHLQIDYGDGVARAAEEIEGFYSVARNIDIQAAPLQN